MGCSEKNCEQEKFQRAVACFVQQMAVQDKAQSALTWFD